MRASTRTSVLLGQEPERAPVLAARSSRVSVDIPPPHHMTSERRTTTVGASSRCSYTLGQQRSRATAPGTSVVPKSSDLDLTIDQPLPHHRNVLEGRATTVGTSSTSYATPGKRRLHAAALGTSSGCRVSVSTVNQTLPHTALERRAAASGASTRYSTTLGYERLRVAVPGTSTGLCKAQNLDSTIDQPHHHHPTQGRRATTVGTSSKRTVHDGQQSLTAAGPSTHSGGSGAVLPPTRIQPSTTRERRSTAVCASTRTTRDSGQTPSSATVPCKPSGVLGASLPRAQNNTPAHQERRATAVGTSYDVNVDVGQKQLHATVPKRSTIDQGAFMSQTRNRVPQRQERHATTVGESYGCCVDVGQKPSTASGLSMSTGDLGAIMPQLGEESNSSLKQCDTNGNASYEGTSEVEHAPLLVHAPLPNVLPLGSGLPKDPPHQETLMEQCATVGNASNDMSGVPAIKATRSHLVDTTRDVKLMSNAEMANHMLEQISNMCSTFRQLPSKGNQSIEHHGLNPIAPCPSSGTLDAETVKVRHTQEKLPQRRDATATSSPRTSSKLEQQPVMATALVTRPNELGASLPQDWHKANFSSTQCDTRKSASSKAYDEPEQKPEQATAQHVITGISSSGVAQLLGNDDISSDQRTPCGSTSCILSYTMGSEAKPELPVIVPKTKVLGQLIQQDLDILRETIEKKSLSSEHVSSTGTISVEHHAPPVNAPQLILGAQETGLPNSLPSPQLGLEGRATTGSTSYECYESLENEYACNMPLKLSGDYWDTPSLESQDPTETAMERLAPTEHASYHCSDEIHKESVCDTRLGSSGTQLEDNIQKLQNKPEKDIASVTMRHPSGGVRDTSPAQKVLSVLIDRTSAQIDVLEAHQAEQQASSIRFEAMLDLHIERSEERYRARDVMFNAMMSMLQGLSNKLDAHPRLQGTTPIPLSSSRPLSIVEEPVVPEALCAEEPCQQDTVHADGVDSPMTTPTLRGAGETQVALGLPHMGAGMAAGLPATNQQTSFVDTCQRTSSQCRTPRVDKDDAVSDCTTTTGHICPEVYEMKEQTLVMALAPNLCLGAVNASGLKSQVPSRLVLACDNTTGISSSRGSSMNKQCPVRGTAIDGSIGDELPKNQELRYAIDSHSDRVKATDYMSPTTTHVRERVPLPVPALVPHPYKSDDDLIQVDYLSNHHNRRRTNLDSASSNAYNGHEHAPLLVLALDLDFKESNRIQPQAKNLNELWLGRHGTLDSASYNTTLNTSEQKPGRATAPDRPIGDLRLKHHESTHLSTSHSEQCQTMYSTSSETHKSLEQVQLHNLVPEPSSSNKNESEDLFKGNNPERCMNVNSMSNATYGERMRTPGMAPASTISYPETDGYSPQGEPLSRMLGEQCKSLNPVSFDNKNENQLRPALKTFNEAWQHLGGQSDHVTKNNSSNGIESQQRKVITPALLEVPDTSGHQHEKAGTLENQVHESRSGVAHHVIVAARRPSRDHDVMAQPHNVEPRCLADTSLIGGSFTSCYGSEPNLPSRRNDVHASPKPYETKVQRLATAVLPGSAIIEQEAGIDQFWHQYKLLSQTIKPTAVASSVPPQGRRHSPVRGSAKVSSSSLRSLDSVQTQIVSSDLKGSLETNRDRLHRSRNPPSQHNTLISVSTTTTRDVNTSRLELQQARKAYAEKHGLRFAPDGDLVAQKDLMTWKEFWEHLSLVHPNHPCSGIPVIPDNRCELVPECSTRAPGTTTTHDDNTSKSDLRHARKAYAVKHKLRFAPEGDLVAQRDLMTWEEFWEEFSRVYRNHPCSGITAIPDSQRESVLGRSTSKPVQKPPKATIQPLVRQHNTARVTSPVFTESPKRNNARAEPQDTNLSYPNTGPSKVQCNCGTHILASPKPVKRGQNQPERAKSDQLLLKSTETEHRDPRLSSKATIENKGTPNWDTLREQVDGVHADILRTVEFQTRTLLALQAADKKRRLNTNSMSPNSTVQVELTRAIERSLERDVISRSEQSSRPPLDLLAVDKKRQVETNQSQGMESKDFIRNTEYKQLCKADNARAELPVQQGENTLLLSSLSNKAAVRVPSTHAQTWPKSIQGQMNHRQFIGGKTVVKQRGASWPALSETNAVLPVEKSVNDDSVDSKSDVQTFNAEHHPGARTSTSGPLSTYGLKQARMNQRVLMTDPYGSQARISASLDLPGIPGRRLDEVLGQPFRNSIPDDVRPTVLWDACQYQSSPAMEAVNWRTGRSPVPIKEPINRFKKCGATAATTVRALATWRSQSPGTTNTGVDQCTGESAVRAPGDSAGLIPGDLLNVYKNTKSMQVDPATDMIEHVNPCNTISSGSPKGLSPCYNDVVPLKTLGGESTLGNPVLTTCPGMLMRVPASPSDPLRPVKWGEEFPVRNGLGAETICTGQPQWIVDTKRQDIDWWNIYGCTTKTGEGRDDENLSPFCPQLIELDPYCQPEPKPPDPCFRGDAGREVQVERYSISTWLSQFVKQIGSKCLWIYSRGEIGIMPRGTTMVRGNATVHCISHIITQLYSGLRYSRARMTVVVRPRIQTLAVMAMRQINRLMFANSGNEYHRLVVHGAPLMMEHSN